MSLAVSTYYWDHCTAVKGSARLVILALADYCNDAGWCFPSVAELARRCQLSDRGIQKVLARLAAGGHIAVGADGSTRKTGGSPTHRYHLLAYQRSLAGAQGEPARSPCGVPEDEQMRSPNAADQGEPMCSSSAADEGEQIDAQGEQIDAQGERASSPERARSIRDPNTTANAARGTPTDYQKVVAAYHDAIGTLTPIVEEEIKAELTRSSRDWVLRAIAIAAMRNHRSWAYAAGILRRWHADGYDGGPDQQGSKPRSNSGKNAPSKSTGYGRQTAPAVRGKGQSIEDYADDPEYYAQLKAIYAGGPVTPAAGS